MTKGIKLAAVSIALLGIVALVVLNPRMSKAVLGIASVKITNETANPLEQVIVHLSDGQASWTQDAGKLMPGASATYNKFSSELYINQVDYQVSGSSQRRELHGLACRGETFVVGLRGAQGVSTSYAADW